jgi:hypothetical protein
MKKPITVEYYYYEDKEYKRVTPKYFYYVMHTKVGMMLTRFPNPPPSNKLLLPEITRLMNSFGYTRKEGFESMHVQDMHEAHNIDKAYDGTYVGGFGAFYLVVWEDNELKVIRNPLKNPQIEDSSA